MEHLLRYALLALLEQPRSDLRDVLPLFIDTDFQRAAVARITDPQVRYFWEKEYRALRYKNSPDAVAPIANKLGAFLAHPLVRQAVCEPEEPLRFRRLMDDGRCLIVNLATGRLSFITPPSDDDVPRAYCTRRPVVEMRRSRQTEVHGGNGPTIGSAPEALPRDLSTHARGRHLAVCVIRLKAPTEFG